MNRISVVGRISFVFLTVLSFQNPARAQKEIVEVAKFQASDKEDTRFFGFSVSIDGDQAIAGAEYELAAFIFRRDATGTWSEATKLKPSETDNAAQFGISVSISGDLAIVGASRENTGKGAAYVFERVSPRGWREVQILQGEEDLLFDNRFGTAVSISGNRVIVGSDDASPVYIFERDASGTWNEVARIRAAWGASRFGGSVSISTDWAIIGADRDVTSGVETGAAYIVERNAKDEWRLKQKLLASDRGSNFRFGTSVSISGDRAIVGSNPETTGDILSGTAYIFERDSEEGWSEVNRLQASDKTINDGFGFSVSISGNQAVVGADYVSAFYIFRDDNEGQWSEILKLNGSPGTSRFGRSVSISGDRIIVGANQEAETGILEGAAYVYESDSGGTWNDGQELRAIDKELNAQFGISVSISNDLAVVGANRDADGGVEAGAAYIFERSGGEIWREVQKLQASDKDSLAQFGISVSLSGDLTIVGAAGAESAYIFERNSAGWWSEVAKLQASDKTSLAKFGISVSIFGDRAIVGANRESSGSVGTGAAYIFERDAAGIWSESEKLQPSGTKSNALFGTSVSISHDRAIVGADGAAEAYIFERASSGTTWSEVAKFRGSPRSYGFGVSVSIAGDRAIVGANEDESGPGSGGAAYVIDRDFLGDWSYSRTLYASDAKPGDQFGSSVSISGDVAIVGANRVADGGVEAGAAYIFKTVDGITWPEVAMVQASDRESLAQFGMSVSLSGERAFIGAFRDDASGSAYVFDLAPTEVSVVGGDELPGQFALIHNYPNPFSQETTISFEIPTTTSVKLGVYNVLGRELEILVDGVVSAGIYETTFNASPYPSGFYLYRLETGAGTMTRSMILLR